MAWQAYSPPCFCCAPYYRYPVMLQGFKTEARSTPSPGPGAEDLKEKAVFPEEGPEQEEAGERGLLADKLTEPNKMYDEKM